MQRQAGRGNGGVAGGSPFSPLSPARPLKRRRVLQPPWLAPHRGVLVPGGPQRDGVFLLRPSACRRPHLRGGCEVGHPWAPPQGLELPSTGGSKALGVPSGRPGGAGGLGEPPALGPNGVAAFSGEPSLGPSCQGAIRVSNPPTPCPPHPSLSHTTPIPSFPPSPSLCPCILPALPRSPFVSPQHPHVLSTPPSLEASHPPDTPRHGPQIPPLPPLTTLGHPPSFPESSQALHKLLLNTS